ncbi:hypothetical protein BDV97DRAFT_395731 [Delphinella strobiligena]|nr:hypothetical protein BDV97DRAFT_395731 [Delphinella strobiligena]
MCFYEAQVYPCRKHIISYILYYECSWLTTRRLWNIYNSNHNPRHDDELLPDADAEQTPYANPSKSNSDGKTTPTTKNLKPNAHRSGYHGQSSCGYGHPRSRWQNIIVVDATCPTCGVRPNQNPIEDPRFKFISIPTKTASTRKASAQKDEGVEEGSTASTIGDARK